MFSWQEMVADLRQQGYRVLIITNGHAEIQRGKLEQVHAVELFDGILVGGEEVAAGRAEKPAVSIFLRACEMAGCTPDEVRTFFQPITQGVSQHKSCVSRNQLSFATTCLIWHVNPRKAVA